MFITILSEKSCEISNCGVSISLLVRAFKYCFICNSVKPFHNERLKVTLAYDFLRYSKNVFPNLGVVTIAKFFKNTRELKGVFSPHFINSLL